MSSSGRTWIRLSFIMVKIGAIVVMATQASQKFVYGGF
jgi:hypothetical protein